MKTYQPKQKEVSRNWHLIDAKDQVLGRLATQVATILMGKHKPTYSTHMDMGDNVIVINAKKIELTGRKESQKVYIRHTNYPSGLRSVKVADMRERKPERIIEYAVSGMLPKNKLRDKRLRRLKVFADASHPYENKFKKEVKDGK